MFDSSQAKTSYVGWIQYPKFQYWVNDMQTDVRDEALLCVNASGQGSRLLSLAACFHITLFSFLGLPAVSE